MKVFKILPLLATATILSLTSCSTETFPDDDIAAVEITHAPQAKQIEIEILELINQYRIEQGLNALGNHNTVKAVAYTHTDYMVETEQVNHDNFPERRLSLQQNADARLVSENVAYGYTSAQSVVTAWLNSPGHKANIEGDFTDFDISAEQNEEGKWYYTNMFIKR